MKRDIKKELRNLGEDIEKEINRIMQDKEDIEIMAKSVVYLATQTQEGKEAIKKATEKIINDIYSNKKKGKKK